MALAFSWVHAPSVPLLSVALVTKAGVMPGRVNVTVKPWPGAGLLMRVNRICTGVAPPELLVPAVEDAKELLFPEDAMDIELPAPKEEDEANAADDDEATMDAAVLLAPPVDVAALLEERLLPREEVSLAFELLLETLTPEETVEPDDDDDDEDVDVVDDVDGQPAARSIRTTSGMMRRARPMDRPPLLDAYGALWTGRNESNRPGSTVGPWPTGRQ